MRKLKYLLVICAVLSLVSCNDDFLERTPLDQISQPDFWKTTSDLDLYANSFYNDFPGWASYGNGISLLPDNGTDHSIGSGPSSRLDGTAGIPIATTATLWSWTKVRKVNYFISNMSKAQGLEVDLNQYKGEGYFFRAYYYYDLLRKYGDLPIYKEYFDEKNTEALFRARSPRNQVVDFMLADLDMAISMLKPKSALSVPRVNKEAAQLLKATVALYEGTWEKYHAGTVFGVAGSTGTTYLQQAADASNALIIGNTRSLHTDYGGLFNQTKLTSNTEVILWREYDLLVGTAVANDAQLSWPNGSSYTQDAIRSYLATDGKPIAVSPLYQGDKSLATIEKNRDPRLAATLMVPGDVTVVTVNGAVTTFKTPLLTGTTGAVGGYESQKYRIPQYDATTSAFTRNTAKIIMRYAEALLIYAEAKAELGTITQNDLNISINKLRDRTGVKMPPLTLASITTDPNWPDYGYTLSPVLQEIRRERGVELMSEGFRLDDLMRWRAHNLIVGKKPLGAYYETGWAINQKKTVDNYLDPYQTSLPTGYRFNPLRDYLLAIPSNELLLNTNLVQNPGWVN